MPGQQWHAWPLLRCLELETSITSFLQGTDMQAFSQLHTLKLRAWGAASWPISEGDLDLTSLPSLRRLHIENWSPESISVTTRCRVHANLAAAKEGWNFPSLAIEHAIGSLALVGQLQAST